MQNKIDLLSYYLKQIIVFKFNHNLIRWHLVAPYLTYGFQTVSTILKLGNKLCKNLKEKIIN